MLLNCTWFNEEIKTEIKITWKVKKNTKLRILIRAYGEQKKGGIKRRAFVAEWWFPWLSTDVAMPTDDGLISPVPTCREKAP